MRIRECVTTGAKDSHNECDVPILLKNYFVCFNTYGIFQKPSVSSNPISLHWSANLLLRLRCIDVRALLVGLPPADREKGKCAKMRVKANEEIPALRSWSVQ